MTNIEKHDFIYPQNFYEFTYSKKEHFRIFRERNSDVELLKSEMFADTSDLKVYQDLLTFLFIKDNIKPGSRILEIGGGDSRILKYFKDDYECWNLDKMEGLGNGPVKFQSENFRIIYDYIGNLNIDLPENYFDFIFSISTLEHVPIDNEDLFGIIIKDINRLLKTGGYSMHCIDHTTDLLLGTVDEVWTNPLITYLFKNEKVINKFIPLVVAENDPGLFTVSEEFYNKHWKPVTNVDYKDFGKPFSYNLLWKK